MEVIVQNKGNYQEKKESKNDKYNIIILGAGGFGREVYLWSKDTFPKDNYRIKGFLDDNSKALDGYDLNIDIIGSIDDYIPDEYDRFLIATGVIDAKENVIDILKKKGAKFINLIHPKAVVADNTKIGSGVVICPNSLIATDVQIGNYVTINCGTQIGHDVIIKDYTSIMSQVEIGGDCKLGSKVFMGSNSTIIPGRKIGDNAIIGAGSVIIRHVKENTSVFGNPAKRIE